MLLYKVGEGCLACGVAVNGSVTTQSVGFKYFMVPLTIRVHLIFKTGHGSFTIHMNLLCETLIALEIKTN
jgi:hypothetical protein